MAALFPDLVVNGETVLAAVAAAEAQNHEAPKGKPGVAWRKAAAAVAIKTLLLQEARARGIEARAEEVGPGRFETEEEAMVRGLLDEATAAARPTEAEVRAEWEKDPLRFRASVVGGFAHPRGVRSERRGRPKCGARPSCRSARPGIRKSGQLRAARPRDQRLRLPLERGRFGPDRPGRGGSGVRGRAA